MMKQILIIEDDEIIREELTQFLNNKGYKVLAPTTDAGILDDIYKENYALILLDINLPNQDGFALCRQIRSFSQVPIIFITALNNSMDELNALMMGGDDYVTKPYNLPVLLARIESLLKRVEQNLSSITYKGLVLNLLSGYMEYNGAAAELTKTELKVMYCLLSKGDEFVPRIDLIEYLWDNQIYIDDNTLSVNITRLRNKLYQIGLKDWIHTKRGMGYKI